MGWFSSKHLQLLLLGSTATSCVAGAARSSRKGCLGPCQVSWQEPAHHSLKFSTGFDGCKTFGVCLIGRFWPSSRLGRRLSALPREFPGLAGAMGEQPLKCFHFCILCLEQTIPHGLNFNRVMLGYPHATVKAGFWNLAFPTCTLDR